MAQHPVEHAALPCLRTRIALSITLEEELIAAMSRFLTGMGDEMPSQEVRAIERFIRTHRVGVIKHRAIMGAHSIDV